MHACVQMCVCVCVFDHQPHKVMCVSLDHPVCGWSTVACISSCVSARHHVYKRWPAGARHFVGIFHINCDPGGGNCVIQCMPCRLSHVCPLAQCPPNPPPASPQQTPLAGQPSKATGGLSGGGLIGVIVAAALAVVLLLGAATAYVLLYRSRNGLLSGRQGPPQHGPDVTLVATDIQVGRALHSAVPVFHAHAGLHARFADSSRGRRLWKGGRRRHKTGCLFEALG